MNIIPSRITAGDSLSLSVPSPGALPSDGWALSLVLVPADGASGGTVITAASSVADPQNSAAFLLTIDASTTAAWAPRAYTWVQRATRSAERVTLASGRTTVLADPATLMDPLDLRSTAAKALASIDAYLLDSKNLQAASYTLGGRSLSRYTRAELIAERSKWQAEVAKETAAERAAAGLGGGRRVFVRWGA